MPVSSGYLLKTIVDPTMFFTIVVEGKPVNCISFKTASWDLKKRDLVIRLPPSHNYSRTWVTGGDFTCHSGTDGKSFYRETFEDGNFIQEHMEPAILFMANADPRIKDSQIFICITKQTCGLSKGEGFHSVMKTMAHFGSRNDKTIIKFTIVDLDNSDVFDLCVS